MPVALVCLGSFRLPSKLVVDVEAELVRTRGGMDATSAEGWEGTLGGVAAIAENEIGRDEGWHEGSTVAGRRFGQRRRSGCPGAHVDSSSHRRNSYIADHSLSRCMGNRVPSNRNQRVF